MRRVLAFGLVVCAAYAQAGIDFSRDIQPIFAERCYACHGPRQQMNGLRFDDRSAAMRVIVPGKSSASALIQRVSSTNKRFAMPPVGAPLTAAQIAKLRAWIDAGANWPASASSAPAAAHWSFRPVSRPAVPAIKQRNWVRNPVDAFILARLEKEGVAPSPEADRATLIRRVSYDLTGLPPSPEELHDFLEDKHPDAYERLVDRLIASPHYGEKWARYWLDLAHYADSDGYEKDRPRPWAWRYRQWVIDALNAGMPFDEFTVEQLAGDLLPNATVEQRVATGFLRNTLTNREAGVDRREARFEQVVDRTNTTATTWLALTVGCAQCHNHKFDPISHKEYYSFFAFFDSAGEQEIDAPLPGQAGPYLRALPEYSKKRAALLAEFHIPELEAQWESQLRDAYKHPGKDLEWDFALTGFRAMFDRADKFLADDPAKRSARDQERMIEFFLEYIGPQFSKDKEKTAELKKARSKLDELHKTLPEYAQAPVVAFDPTIPPAHIHRGGDYATLGDEVSPDVPEALPPLNGPKTRLGLARWLVSRDNPLTARVAVNRMWQEFFGRGLVRTSEDFGSQGEKPSHPELLDWLAAEFMDRGWSIKAMHRLIVTSATYRQSSNRRKDLETKDPENELVARQSRLRLPAELVRDAALAASGLLNPAVGGKSVRPPQPAGVAELGYSNSVKWVESEGVDRYRRGMYIHYQRTTPYPLLATFDAPDSNTACTRRRRSNTPLQALNLLNDPVFFEAAQGLAARILREAPGSLNGRIDYAFELCLARRPSERERERLVNYFDRQLTALRSDAKAATALMPVQLENTAPEERAAWVEVARALLNLDEFITRD